MDQESRALLSCDTCKNEQQFSRTPKVASCSSLCRPAILLYLIAVHCALLSSIVLGIASRSHQNQNLLYTSTFTGLRLSYQDVGAVQSGSNRYDSKFMGSPTAQVASAWEELLQPLYFNATRDELLAARVSPTVSVKVEQGGFIANLGVYHQLHCLNQMRNFLWSHRHHGFCTQDMSQWYHHLDHCIEILRLSSMCAPDLDLYTFTWPRDPDWTSLDAHSAGIRKCVDWGEVEAWSRKRKIPLTSTVVPPDHFSVAQGDGTSGTASLDGLSE